MNHSLQKNPPPIAAFWFIWLAIINGLFIMLFFAAGGIPKGANEGTPPVWIITTSAAMIVVAIAIRLLAIPRIKEFKKLLTAMIAGLAIAETVGILSIFLLEKEFPETRITLFVTSVSCVVLYAPTYANKLASEQR